MFISVAIYYLSLTGKLKETFNLQCEYESVGELRTLKHNKANVTTPASTPSLMHPAQRDCPAERKMLFWGRAWTHSLQQSLNYPCREKPLWGTNVSAPIPPLFLWYLVFVTFAHKEFAKSSFLGLAVGVMWGWCLSSVGQEGQVLYCPFQTEAWSLLLLLWTGLIPPRLHLHSPNKTINSGSLFYFTVCVNSATQEGAKGPEPQGALACFRNPWRTAHA